MKNICRKACRLEFHILKHAKQKISGFPEENFKKKPILEQVLNIVSQKASST
jgi:hypothetical protein